MGLCEFVAAALTIQLVVGQENCPGLRLSTGLGALLGDLPLSSSLPSLPSLPSLDSGGDLSLPPLPSLASVNSLPPLPPLPCETALPPLPFLAAEPGLHKRALPRRRRCHCKGQRRPPLSSAPLSPPPSLPPPAIPPPLLPPPYLPPPPIPEPGPNCGCRAAVMDKDKPTKGKLEELLLKKGLALGLGPDSGLDVGLLPDALSAFALDALARPLGAVDDCGL